MSLTARRERERFEVREKILDAARSLLVERGKEGVTMRKIAAEIEYSPTVIYSHFKDKQALLCAVAEEDYSSLTGKIQKHHSELNPLERLRLIGIEIINYVLENPDHFLMFAQLPKSNQHRPVMQVVDEQLEEDINDIVIKTIREAIQQSCLNAGLRDAELIAQTFFAGIHGVITVGMHNNDERLHWRPIEQRLALMVDLLICGLIDNRQKS